MIVELLDRADAELPLGARVARALRRWLKVAGYLAGITVLLYVLSGGEVLTKYGSAVRLEWVLLFYLSASMLAGLIAGLLTPLGATLAGTVVAMWCCMFPVGWLGLAAFRGIRLMDPVALLGAAIFAVGLGTIYGVIDWRYRPNP